MVIPGYSCPKGVHPWGYTLGYERILQKEEKPVIYTFSHEIIVLDKGMSLRRGAFCSGFLCHNATVPSREVVIPGCKKGVHPCCITVGYERCAQC